MDKESKRIYIIEAKAENRREFTQIVDLMDKMMHKYKTNEDHYAGKDTVEYTIQTSKRRFNKLWRKLNKRNPRVSNVCVIL